MGDPRPRLLFVGHDASRTGAPTLGLTFLRWLVAQREAHVTITLLAPGPLARDHTRLAPTRVLAPPGRMATGFGAVRPKGIRPPRIPPTPADVVVANSLASLPAAAQLDPARLVCWVHELDGVADRLVPRGRRDALLAQVDHFVAAGDRVGAMLTDRWRVPGEKVTAVDPFTDPPDPRALDDTVPAHGSPVILGSGSLVARKGADAFVAALAALAALDSTRTLPRAAWVGGAPTSPFGRQVQTDIAQSHLGDAVGLVPDVATLDTWWPHHGLLVHAAREDPFPLVVLEAAVRGIPTVTWDTGGAADLVRRAGLDHLVAEPGDVLGLSRRVAALIDHPTDRAAAGQAMALAALDLTTERLAPVVWAASLGRPR